MLRASGRRLRRPTLAVLYSSRPLIQALKFLLQTFQFFVTEMFQIHEACSSAGNTAQEFIELQMDRLGISILRILNQEDDEKCYDGGCGVDNQLPGIGKMEKGTHNGPQHNYAASQYERPG